ncbi:T9SS-dependent choice-of-anchor J family protein [Epilithonimonas mollis]|uniref:Por secretion system C-terminal sorting domain-containing protein n=1 Tax=Epilithonimonas mollis TaxID=216903 RepID=A0A1M6MXW2_9FLAO|nr:choice-of-anchor J domain-containing protein [Epilithonimonas mollis]SHJ88341.1 Por secretion system C-terminal sorting domain-containing protein [Epilithonimonas mollis]
MIKKLLFAGALALAFNSMNAQTVIFEDSFETYTDFAYTTGTVGNWTLRDLDGKNSYKINGSDFPNQSIPKAFIVFNKQGITPTVPTSTQFDANTGDKVMACFNAVSSPWNNDWLISPKIKLGSSDNVLSFWAKPINELYGEEKFNVLVSTTDTNTASFTKVNTAVIVTDPIVEYAEYTFNLDAYKDKDVYIAIQCVSDDQFALLVDDFKVVGNVLAVSDVNKKSVSVYPNPTTDYLTINQRVNSAEVYDMTGKLVASPAVVDSKVDVKSLQNGTYVLKVNTAEGSTSHKFIKK